MPPRRLHLVIPEVAFPADPSDPLFEGAKNRIPPDALGVEDWETAIYPDHPSLVAILHRLLDLLGEIDAVRINIHGQERRRHRPTVYEGVHPDTTMVQSALAANEHVLLHDPRVELLLINETMGTVRVDMHRIIRIRGELPLDDILAEHMIPLVPGLPMVDEMAHTHVRPRPWHDEQIHHFLHSMGIDGGNW
ncbi:MAG: hypothetical protein PHW10_01920 [Candidatus Peribacteraceae bacterium]|nr:hypothetical protein [Candidatus Peribacteraceae bacterium]